MWNGDCTRLLWVCSKNPRDASGVLDPSGLIGTRLAAVALLDASRVAHCLATPHSGMQRLRLSRVSERVCFSSMLMCTGACIRPATFR